MKTIVIHPYLKKESGNRRTPEARLEEAVRLTQAISLEMMESLLVPLAQYRPSTLIGEGKADEIKAIVTGHEAGLVVVDGALSPAQQRNLEKIWECKVIDRTALILEIFGARARTHEGKLQVELAALNYQKSRLVRSWTHLERQRGGFGFLGGPGESQIEIDRRLIRDRIAKIKRELESVTRTRELHRKTRRDIPYPVVALVGYTNAGKSTLFNRLTHAKVMAMDKLFATLDPTLRAIKLPSGLHVILSDTVGFISELPHELVAAFRATLEEVTGADLLLHVRDIAHPDTTAQKEDVLGVLGGLIAEEELSERMLEVWNKIDQLPDDYHSPSLTLPLKVEGTPSPFRERAGERVSGNPVSALTGAGIPELLTAIDTRLSELFMTTMHLKLPVTEGDLLAWLYRHGTVLQQEERDGIFFMRVRMTHENAARWAKERKRKSGN